jgi:hypothetical protein
MVVTGNNYPPTPTPTASATPTPTPDVTKSCNFTGIVTFNTLDGNINCATSKKFIDCATGKDYYSTEIILDPIGNPLKSDYVYGGTINGISSCFIFFGLVDNISGVDKIDVTVEYGPEDQGSCIFCSVNPTATPTPTPTQTPTPTPTSTPLLCISYKVSNSSYLPNDCEFTNCLTSQIDVISVSGGATIIVCSTTEPTGPNLTSYPGLIC